MAKFEMDTEFIRKLAAHPRRDRSRRDRAGRRRPAHPRRPARRDGGGRTGRGGRGRCRGAAAGGAAPAAAAADDLGKHPGAVKSPMVGTAYLAPEPGKPNSSRSATR